MDIRPTRPWPQILLGGYWLTLLTATHWPKLPGLDVPGKDKTLHVVAFAILAGLLLNVLARRRESLSRFGIAFCAVAAAGLYGALDEWTQPFTGRSCELLDWAADLTGATSVSITYLLATALKPARS